MEKPQEGFFLFFLYRPTDFCFVCYFCKDMYITSVLYFGICIHLVLVFFFSDYNNMCWSLISCNQKTFKKIIHVQWDKKNGK